MKFLYSSVTCFILSVFLGSTLTYSQITKNDYHKGDSLSRYNDLVYHANVDPSWIRDTHNFWYKVNTKKGEVYFIVDADKRINDATHVANSQAI